MIAGMMFALLVLTLGLPVAGAAKPEAPDAARESAVPAPDKMLSHDIEAKRLDRAGACWP